MATMKNLLGKMIDKINIKPDWNQNDENADDYIKNRPFWTSDPVETTIVEETTFELVNGMGQLTATQPLEAGQEYTVNLDGINYSFVAKIFEQAGVSYIGNLGLIGAGEDTGESFLIAPTQSETELVIAVNSDVVEHTVSIVGNIAEVHQLDEKYVPDSILENVNSALEAKSKIVSSETREVIPNLIVKEGIPTNSMFSRYVYTVDEYLLVNKLPLISYNADAKLNIRSSEYNENSYDALNVGESLTIFKNAYIVNHGCFEYIMSFEHFDGNTISKYPIVLYSYENSVSTLYTAYGFFSDTNNRFYKITREFSTEERESDKIIITRLI